MQGIARGFGITDDAEMDATVGLVGSETEVSVGDVACFQGRRFCANMHVEIRWNRMLGCRRFACGASHVRGASL